MEEVNDFWSIHGDVWVIVQRAAKMRLFLNNYRTVGSTSEGLEEASRLQSS